MISANGGLPAHRYTPQVTQRWPRGSIPASLRPYATPTLSPHHLRSRSPQRRHARHRRPTSTSPSPYRPHRAPRFPLPPVPIRQPQPPPPPLPQPPPHVHLPLSFPSPPVPVLHPQPPPPPLPLPQTPPQPPPPQVHVLPPPLQDLELRPLRPPGPRPPCLVVCPRFAVAPPLGEVGRGSGKARRGAHGAHLRGGAYQHPCRPKRGRPGGHHAASGMGGPPPRRGPGTPPPSTPPKPSANGSRPSSPRPGPAVPPPHPTTTTPGRGRARARGGQGAARDTRARGHGGAGAHRDRAPEEIQRGARKPPKDEEGTGAGTEAQRKRAPRQAPRPAPRKGIPRQRDQRRLTPSERRTTPRDAHPQHAPLKQEADAIRIIPAHTHHPPEATQVKEGTPTPGEQATPTEEATGNTAARRTTTTSPPRDDPVRHKGHLAGTGRGRRHCQGNHG